MKFPFHAIIKPVGDICNLNCSYCFYKEKSGQGDVMNEQTLERITQQYISEQPASCKEVQFVWQGGEPTVAGLDFFEKAIELQKEYARPGLQITNALQTNGLLLNDNWAAFLKANDFLVGISIDGMKAFHDQHRITYTNKGSFDRALSGYELLEKYGVTTNILCVVHDDNVEHGKDIYRYFVEGLEARSIQFLPVVGEQTVNAGTWGAFLKEVFDAWIENGLGTVTVQLFDATFARIAQGVETFCVHANDCGRQLAIERNGDVYSCDHYVENAYRLGNINQQSFTDFFASPLQQQFNQASMNHSKACGDCKVKGLCQSGCPKHRDLSGRNKLCEGYCDFFTHSLPYNYAIAESLRRGVGVAGYRQFLPHMKIQVAQAI